MLPISRGMLMSGSRGMVQPGKGRRKRVCRRIRKLLDKKSKSQTVDKVPAKAGIFYTFSRLSGIIIIRKAVLLC